MQNGGTGSFCLTVCDAKVATFWKAETKALVSLLLNCKRDLFAPFAFLSFLHNALVPYTVCKSEETSLYFLFRSTFLHLKFAPNSRKVLRKIHFRQTV